MKRFFLTLICLPIVLNAPNPPPSSGGTKKALLVGIANYKNLPYYSKYLGRELKNLKGPINDVRITREVLISRYGFRPEEINVLINQQATRDNIIGALESLIQETREGDVVVFYFSGHGTQVPDQNGDEEDGRDEALAAYDVVPEGAKNPIEAKLILDDELGQILRKLKAGKAVVIVDACYSGTMTRGIRGVPVSILEETPAWQSKFIPVNVREPDVRERSFSINIPRQKDIPEGQVFLSSSREHQLSLEMQFPDGHFGAFTKALVEGTKRRNDVTYQELYEDARKAVLRLTKDMQDPQIEALPSGLLTSVVFAPPLTVVAQAKPEVKKPQEQKAPLPPKPAPKPPLTPQQVKPQERPPGAILSPQATSPAQTPPSIPLVAPKPPPEVKGKKVLLRVEPLRGASPSMMKTLRSRLERVPYVEVVQDGFFDRLLRGEVKDSKYLLRVLNRIGDVVKIPPAKGVDELIKGVAPHLEYAYIVKQLAYISNPNPPFKVKISVAEERQDFRIGEKIVYNVSCEEDCYLLMLNLDPEGNFHVIFPNQYHKDNFRRGGELFQIPDEKMRKDDFELQLFPPAGEETVKVIATNTRLEVEGLNLNVFQEKFKTISGSAMRKSSPSRELADEIYSMLERGSRKKGFRWSEGTVVVRSHE